MIRNSNEVAKLAGCSYRQLNHWTSKKLVGGPVSVGTGHPQRYTEHQTLRVMLLAELVRCGFEHHAAAEILDHWDPIIESATHVVVARGRVLISLDVVSFREQLATVDA